MERLLTYCVLCLVLVGVAQGQQSKRPPLRVPEAVEKAVQIVPAGWRIQEDAAREADLNGDGRPDVALVLSTGGQEADADNEETRFVKHVLVLALRGADGRLHRSIVSDAAVLNGDEGGVFGDPFQGLTIERGTVVIQHYGGSRDRWSFTHRYRYQNNQWTLIGLTTGNTDTLDLEHYDEQDINLSTGLVNAKERPETPEGQKPKAEISGSYYELEALPLDSAPSIDGQISAGEWPGYTVRLSEARHVYRNRQAWRGAEDLSAQLHAVRVGDALFISAEVKDNDVGPGDEVRLVTKSGHAIKPSERKLTPSGRGYVVEARFSLKEIATALKPSNEYIVEQVEGFLNPTEISGDTAGLPLAVAVEIIDVDDSATPKARSVLSTRLAGSPYNGSVRIFGKGALLLTDDKEQ